MATKYGEKKSYFLNYGLPSLLLDFAKRKSLIDAISKTNLITFNRSSAGTYIGADGLIKTAAADEPRFDHDPVTGESLGLLIEEQRTNLVNKSIPSGWGDFGRSIETTGIIAPDGSNDAKNYNNTGGSNSDYVYTNFNTSFSIGDRYVISVFSTFSETIISQGGLANGKHSAITDTQHINYSNGWYRHWREYEATQDNPNIAPQIVIYTSGGQSNLSLWGLQVESGQFPTSYIPTNGSTATRGVDSVLLSTSNWWDYTQGTAYAEYRGGLESNQGGYGRVWSPGGTSTFIAGSASQFANNRHNVWFSGSSVDLSGQEHLSAFAKNAITYSNNGTNCDIVTVSYPAIATGTTNSSVASPFHGIGRNAHATTNMLNGHIKRLTYYSTILTNTQLQTLTQ